MKIGVLGTGVVGQTLSLKLAAHGQDVVIGTRDVARTLASNEPNLMGLPPFGVWHREHPGAKLATYAAAAQHGEVIINATNGAGALDALRLAGAANLNGKILIDVTNPLDFSHGMPPTLFVCNTDSLGEQIQRAYPGVQVVKALNTVTAYLMVDPGLVNGGDHTLFVCGNDMAAKTHVTAWLKEWFGWRDILDLGDITAARGMETYLPLWLRMMGALGTGMLSVKVVK